jgi:2,4-dienoyl-CoA reductase-like NADH-dependent reductase (Old Yellow Enzyme family)
MTDLFTPLTLPNGTQLSNRLCKAAMEENLCDAGQIPGDRLVTLYQQWAQGGVGLILTGNVMVSPDALTGPGGVVLQNDQHLDRFKAWASAAKKGGAQVWMQLSHPGRQVYAAMGEQAVAPSAIALNIPGFSKMFAQPRALEEHEIKDIIQRFANASALAEQAGFTGCQIHAAHGYLLSQFLSPLTNKREDQWGGSLENRARFLFATVDAVRAKVSSDFCVSIKLNSADFQKGGFDQADAKWVVEQLNSRKVDLVELSGGSYESPAMQGNSNDDSTGEREAFFIQFAGEIARVANMPIMVTGGIRRRQVAIDALDDSAGYGVSVLGVARAMAFVPDLPNAWQADQKLDVELPRLSWENSTIAALGVMSMTKAQLNRMAKGLQPKAGVNPILSIIQDRLNTRLRTKCYRRWREQS